MRVQETDDVAVLFFALQGPGAIEAHADSLTCGTPHAPAKPDPAATCTEQNPALFNERLHDRGCTRQ
jgi:hypothetical protein